MALTSDHLPRLFNPLPECDGLQWLRTWTGTLLGKHLAQCVLGNRDPPALPIEKIRPLPFRTLQINGLEMAFRLARAKTIMRNLAQR